MEALKRRAFNIGLLWLAACGGGDGATADSAPQQGQAPTPTPPPPAGPSPAPGPAPSPVPTPSPGPSPSPAPDTGLYVSAQYATSRITQHRDLIYSRRPNAGSQFTSEITRVAEQSSGAQLVLKLDLAVPPNASAQSRQPLIVWLHGGGLVSGGKEEVADQMLSYAQAGYVAASVNYRLTPGIETNAALRVRALQQAVEDTMNAIRFLRANAATYGIDASRVATFGNSAGGSISLVNAIEFDTLTGTVSDYPGVTSKVQGAVSTGATLVDGTSNSDSLVHYDAGDTPVLLYHANPTDGTSGATWSAAVLPTQSRINGSGNSCVVVAQPDRSHTVDLSLGGAYWPAAKAFLWARLRLAELR